MQTINISLKAFDGVYLRKAFSEIGKILFFMDHCHLKSFSDKKQFLSIPEKKALAIKNKKESPSRLLAAYSKQSKTNMRKSVTSDSGLKKQNNVMPFLSKNSNYTDKTLSNFKFFSYPKTKTIYTVIRSPHIDKKSREQFEFNKYKSQIIVTSSNFSQVSLLLFFLKNCKFTGVELNFSVEYSTFLKI